MNLGKFLGSLTKTTLRNVNLGGNDQDGPTTFNYPELVYFINDGLTNLYQEFYFLSDEIYLQLFDNIQIYDLHSDFAVSNTASTEPLKWIIDTAEKPFEDRILLIESVYNELGEELPLNDETDEASIYTPSPTSIQVVNPSSENALTVIYKKAHDALTYSEETHETSLEQKITLPLAAIQALKYYVAYAATETHPREEVQKQSLLFLQKFDAEVSRIRDKGVFVPNRTPNTKLEKNGWL